MRTPPPPDDYAALGLDRNCTDAQIRSAYRLLAKQLHPDLNRGTDESVQSTQSLNAAYATLSDPSRRKNYDQELTATQSAALRRSRRIQRDIAQDVNLRIEDFFRGASLTVRVNDPANADGPESYPLIVPPMTAPGTRLLVPRSGAFVGGFVKVRMRPLPSFRFKARGSDLRCDLRIKPERAAQGGSETVPGITGAPLRITIPRGAAGGEVIRVTGEGLPKPRGGRGDLLVRITYRPEIRVTRDPAR